MGDGHEAELERLRAEVAALKQTNATASALTPEVAAAILGVPMVLWSIDPGGIITLSEGRGLESLGLKPGQLVGANVFDVYADNPEALEPIRLGLTGTPGYSSVEVGGATWENRYFPRTTEGQVTGLIGISMDVTAQRHAQRERTRSDERWRSIAENGPDRILVLDSEHRIQFINRLPPGVDPSMVHGTPVYAFFDEAQHALARSAIDAALAGQEGGNYRSSRTDPSGATQWFDVRVGPLREGDAVTGALMIATDVTEQHRIEQDKAQLRAQVEHAQKLESLGVLAGGIAHDFNNLLVSIMGHAELARLDLADSHAALPQVVGIVDAAQRAAQLCQQMLAYAGKGRFELRSLDLSKLVQDMAQLLRVSLPKGVELRHTLDPAPWPVRADVAQLQQVAMNLIINASESFEGQRGVVEVRTSCRYCDAAELESLGLLHPLPAGDYVLFEVTDNGCGMSSETRARMFDPFFSTKVTGRGLGMASVLGIVRGHGGGMSVRSAEGEGTTVVMLLPRVEADAIAAPRAAPAEQGGESLRRQAAGRTVLVVDDEAGVRAVAQQMLQWLGFRTLSANDGAEAIRLYRDNREAISLVLLDVSMPVMGGVEVVTALRGIDPRVPIVLSSGYQKGPPLPPGTRVSTLNKPYGLDAFQQAIAEALGEDDAEAPQRTG